MMSRTNSAPLPAQPINWDRRLFHLFAGSVIPLTAFLWGWGPAIVVASVSSAALVTVEAARFRSPVVNRWFVEWLGMLLKPNETQRVTAATYLAVAGLASLLIFDVMVAGLALLFLALADPAAAIVGSRFGRHRWLGVRGAGPRSRPGKSMEGTLAFVAVALGLALLLWYKGAYTLFWPAAVGAVVAAVVEFLPLPVDDNISVPLVSGAAMWALWLA